MNKKSALLSGAVAACVLLIMLIFAVRWVMQAEKSLRIWQIKWSFIDSFEYLRCFYYRDHAMDPMTPADITNSLLCQQVLSHYGTPQKISIALQHMYYIRTTDSYELGAIMENTDKGAEVMAYYRKGKEESSFTNVILPLNCRSAHELARAGFVGLVATGTPQMFGDDPGDSRTKESPP